MGPGFLDFLYHEWVIFGAIERVSTVTTRTYRGEYVCKSWSDWVKISVSYDQNKFSIVFIEKNVHFPVSIRSDCSSYNLNFS